MIIRPVFGSPRQTPSATQAEATRVEAKPLLAWRICPVMNRPVMVWTLAGREMPQMAAAARA